MTSAARLMVMAWVTMPLMLSVKMTAIRRPAAMASR
ncbi:hypothetical protein JHY03_68590 (plasmid) [Streptomyces sp. CA-256286]|nr:hypothetical protein JHY03_68590 [Streptomyces sp. CA-256286]